MKDQEFINGLKVEDMNQYIDTDFSFFGNLVNFAPDYQTHLRKSQEEKNDLSLFIQVKKLSFLMKGIQRAYETIQ